MPYWLRRRIPYWTSLRDVGNSRLLKTSYVWIVFVPLAAKFLQGVSYTLEFEALGNPLTIDLQLPFSWALLFYASVITSCANIVYLTRCPPIIKGFETYKDFESQGRGGDQLIKELKSFFLTRFMRRPGMIGRRAEHFLKTFTRSSDDDAKKIAAKLENSPYDTFEYLKGDMIERAMLGDVFWYIRNILDGSSPVWRAFCAGLYAIGLGLIGFLIVQNIAFVVEFHLGIDVPLL